MRNTKLITAASGILAAAGLVAGGAALANASTPASVPAATGYYSATNGPQGGGPGQGRGSNDTPVTGSELTSVKDAVKAKDSAVTVTSVRKDPDGSYDVFGTTSGSPVMLQVSKDLKTITTGPAGGHGGPGGPDGAGRGSNDTPVTGSELTSVKDAVKAKDSAVTVTSVRKDPDGSYDVFGTTSGSPVMLEVSKDLKTITVNPHGPGHGPGDGSGAAPSAGTVS
ncbi:hypothetical protein [Oryzihumus leptocrescens]|uniref:YpeB-like protein with protease inhibitory function n=1 Tax=Oryzihumus leptocrescens TaxID=297536 RepID=A0A542ZEC2_9MICO|nr:hypothetical protein [Oryzihumus leptocrescens]TQL58683.1 hypothetical protein FB474_0017 [Oryzihumus leptocrescens]